MTRALAARRRRPVVAAALALAALAGDAARGERPLRTATDAPTRRGELTAQQPVDPEPTPDEAATRALGALERALVWLAAQQRTQRDGTFPRAGGRQHVPVPLAALGALAFMSGGSSPDRGPYAREVAQAIDYLLARADMNPTAAARGYLASEGDPVSQMHGHGYATLALAMAWTESKKSARGQRVAEVLEAAVRLIEASQGLEGGWYYLPTSGVDHENSVTVVVLHALRAARDVGVRVDARGIGRAVDYVARCQTEAGAFRYTLDPSSESSLALTAAGIATLNAAGRYGGPEVERALTSLWQQIAERELHERHRTAVSFPYYERFYVALALWTHPDQRMFERWYGAERERVLAAQLPEGSWPDDQFGACYATAMNALFLALPLELLPLYQR